LIEKAVGLFAGPQDGLDPLSHLRIRCALTIQEVGAGRGLIAFDGRQEHKLEDGLG
jgi:hypothetical protein